MRLALLALAPLLASPSCPAKYHGRYVGELTAYFSCHQDTLAPVRVPNVAVSVREEGGGRVRLDTGQLCGILRGRRDDHAIRIPVGQDCRPVGGVPFHVRGQSEGDPMPVQLQSAIWPDVRGGWETVSVDVHLLVWDTGCRANLSGPLRREP